jgi:hypothetical protein
MTTNPGPALQDRHHRKSAEIMSTSMRYTVAALVAIGLMALSLPAAASTGHTAAAAATASGDPTISYSPSSGPVGTPFTITGTGWTPGGTVTATLPYGSPGWFIGYQTPTVNASGDFSFVETVGTGPSGPTPPGAYVSTYAENYVGSSLSATSTFTVIAPSYECSCVTYVRDILAAQDVNLPGGPATAADYTPQWMAENGWSRVTPANGTIPSAGLPMVMVWNANTHGAYGDGHMALVADSWAVQAGLADSGQDPSYNGTSWTITVLHADWAGDCSPAQTTFTGSAWSNLNGVNFYVPEIGTAE